MKSKLPLFSGTIVLSSITTVKTSCSVIEPIVNPINYICSQQECGNGLSAAYDKIRCVDTWTDLQRQAKYFGCADDFKDFLDCTVKAQEEPTCRSDYDDKDDWDSRNGQSSYGYYGYYGYYGSSSSDNDCDNEYEDLDDCIDDFLRSKDDTGSYGYYGYYYDEAAE